VSVVQNWITRIGFTLLPIIVSLIIAAALVLSVGRDPSEVLTNLWEGAFRNSKSFAGVLNFWIPLTLVSIGLVVTFRAGLWNIGVEGQILAGALFASWGALHIQLPENLAPLLVVIEIGLAVLGGMLWAGLAGVLKIWLGVSEIFGGMALNSIVSVWAIYLVAGPWRPADGSAQTTGPFVPQALLPTMSEDPASHTLGLAVKGDWQESAFGAAVGCAYQRNRPERFYRLRCAGWGSGRISGAVHLWQLSTTGGRRHRLFRLTGGDAGVDAGAVGSAHHIYLRGDSGGKHPSARVHAA
jgi:ABC-type uncharacterized transport system permease subunit